MLVVSIDLKSRKGPVQVFEPARGTYWVIV